MQMPVPSTAGVHYRNTTLERQQSELKGTDCHQMQVFSTGVNTNNATLESHQSERGGKDRHHILVYSPDLTANNTASVSQKSPALVGHTYHEVRCAIVV